MTLDVQMDRNARLLMDAAKGIEQRIDDLLAVPKSADRAARIQMAIEMRAEVLAAFSREFGPAADQIVASFLESGKAAVASIVGAGIDTTFAAADSALVNAMMRDTRFELEAVNLQTAAQINEAIYTGAVAGTKRSEIMGQVRQLLTGGTDRAGRPMVQHAETIARTRFMEVNSVVMLQKAGELGIKRFKYAGPTIRDSRPWCVKHAGQEFTLDEIKAWGEQSWAGKKAGDPFSTRGGWNCIHRWVPVVGD